MPLYDDSAEERLVQGHIASKWGNSQNQAVCSSELVLLNTSLPRRIKWVNTCKTLRPGSGSLSPSVTVSYYYYQFVFIASLCARKNRTGTETFCIQAPHPGLFHDPLLLVYVSLRGTKIKKHFSLNYSIWNCLHNKNHAFKNPRYFLESALRLLFWTFPLYPLCTPGIALLPLTIWKANCP